MSRVCAVVFSRYPLDARVRREAEALAEAGFLVDVISLRGQDEPYQELVDRVRVYRSRLQRRRTGKLRYYWEYLWFAILAFVKLSLLHIRNRYSCVHIHNMPDILVFAALLPRLSSAKLILDVHDPMPEVYMAKYSKGESSWAVRVLKILEKCCIKMSHFVITPTIACRDLLIRRGCPQEKICVVINSAQEKIFHQSNTRDENKSSELPKDRFVLMYHGTLVKRNGIHKALEALVLLKDRMPSISFQVYGDGDYVKEFRDLVRGLELEGIVTYHGEVYQEKIRDAIRGIDVGVIPNEESMLWELALPTRIFEYLAMGKPVIAPRTRGILDYFSDESMLFFESGNATSLAQVILEAYTNPGRCREVLAKGVKRYRIYRWEVQGSYFADVVKDLVGEECNRPQSERKKVGSVR